MHTCIHTYIHICMHTYTHFARKRSSSEQLSGVYGFLFRISVNWEVLNGVGVDGVGGIFPFLSVFYIVSLLFVVFLFLFILHFSLTLLEDKGKRLQLTAKMGNFTPTPSAPTPCQTSRVNHLTDWWPLGQRRYEVHAAMGLQNCAGVIRISQLENDSNAAKTSVRAPGCQRMSVNTLLCDTSGRGEDSHWLLASGSEEVRSARGHGFAKLCGSHQGISR